MFFLLYSGTSAFLIIFISNIQRTQKYSTVMYYESIGDYMAGLVGTEVGDKCFTTFDLQRNIHVQRVSVLHQSRNSIPENANAPF